MDLFRDLFAGDFEGYQNLVYLVLAFLIWLLKTVFSKRKKPEAQKRMQERNGQEEVFPRPMDPQGKERQHAAQDAFEQLLRQLEGTSYKPEPTPEPEEEYEEDWFEEEPVEVVKAREARRSPKKGRFEHYEAKRGKKHPVYKMLHNPNSLKNAVVLKEVLERKF